MLFRVTRRLREWLNSANPSLLAYKNEEVDSIKVWYCNLLFIHHRKCLLFTHADSLFSFLIAGVKKADIRDFGRLFRFHATLALKGEGITPNQVEYLLDGQSDQIGKADNRSVLGSMNDYAYMCKLYAHLAGNIEYLNIEEVNRDINRAPYNNTFAKKV